MSNSTPALPASPEARLAQAEGWLAELFAPWVRELGLRPLRLDAGEAEFLLPFSERICRVGGTVCGQALMAAADTAMVFAISAQLGEFRPMTTVTQTTSFMSAVASADVRVVARVLKPGRSLVFGEVELIHAVDGRRCAQATTTYALL